MLSASLPDIRSLVYLSICLLYKLLNSVDDVLFVGTALLKCTLIDKKLAMPVLKGIDM